MAGSALLTIMINAARKAGRSLVRDFGEIENLQVSVKGPGDFVSNADRQAEKIVHDELLKARPTYGFLMEEGGEERGTDGQHRWIIDPLDGTTNFLHGIPLFAVSIGLERAGEMVAGVIYNPIMDELFVAEKGSGAWLNDKKRLRVAGRKHLADAVICTGIKVSDAKQDALQIRQLAYVAPAASGIRRTGSACTDLAWVAAGRFDGYWESGLKQWDMAAGIIIIREAGGIVSDFSGLPGQMGNGEIVAGNEVVHGHLIKALKAVK
jgi:myo-inositol-1(or 4)-monophosphatase